MKIHSKLAISAVVTLMAVAPALGAYDITWCRSVVKEQTVSTLDQPISLVWAAVHDVQRFPNKAAYDACDFSQAETICAASEGGSCELPGLVDGKTYYYGCSVSTHCTEGGQKLALTVSDPVSRRRIFSLCH